MNNMTHVACFLISVCKDGFTEDKTTMQCMESELRGDSSGLNLGMDPVMLNL